MVLFDVLSMVSYYCAFEYLSKTHHFWDIRLQKCRDLENWVTGPSRSLEMSPCDRAHTTSYWRSIVTMALSHVVSEIFNGEKYRDLEISVRVSQGHWKWYHSIDWLWYPIYYCSKVTSSITAPFSTCKRTVTLKPGLGVTLGHTEWTCVDPPAMTIY